MIIPKGCIYKKEKWTEEDNNLLLSKYAIYGSKWKEMESYFKGRASYSIRNGYSFLQKYLKNEN